MFPRYEGSPEAVHPELADTFNQFFDRHGHLLRSIVVCDGERVARYLGPPLLDSPRLARWPNPTVAGRSLLRSVLMVYLDYNASTPLDPRVQDLIFRLLGEVPGNASSIQHRSGRRAAELLEEARERVALLVGCVPRDIVFASGASEAVTLAILGVALAQPKARPAVVVGATEHKAVLSAARLAVHLTGGELRLAPVQADGHVDPSCVRDLVDDRVALVAMMAANNETGVIYPVRAIAEIARQAGALFLCDVTQAAAKSPVDLQAWGVDLAVLSSHKIYGPKGAGALITSRHVQQRLVPVFAGGGQEHGLRGGTHDTPSIAGFGLAAQIAAASLDQDIAHARHLVSRLVSALGERLPGVELIAAESPRLCNTANLRFHGADAEAVMASMPDVEVSAGSACQSAVPEPSHVLRAMGYDATAAAQCLRFSVGRPTTEAEIDYVIGRVIDAVTRVRSLST
jgi:cysteine desulfurase